MGWNKRQVFTVHEDCCQHMELWRSTDKDYRSKQKWTDALQKLAQKYSSDSNSILKKITSLRSYFHKEHSKFINKNVIQDPTMCSLQAGWHTSNSYLCWNQIFQGLEDTINNNDVSIIIMQIHNRMCSRLCHSSGS
jgi:hypothetical protein